MKYFSMFSGIGGFDVALNRLGHKCVGHSEIDKYAEAVYQLRLGGTNYGDATQIDPSRIPDFDILCGGFPCQSFSIAGKRGGFADTRGTLFYEVARIAKAKRPRILFLENVKGLLSHDEGRTLAVILDTIRKLGYDVEFGVVNSRYFGVPQNRERIFIVGRARDRSGGPIFPIRQSQGEVGEARKPCSATIHAGYYKQGGRDQQYVTEQMGIGISRDEGIIGEINTAFSLNSSDWRGLNRNQTQTAIIHNVYGGFGEETPRIFTEYSPTIRTPQGGGHLPMVISFQTRSPDRPSLKYSSGGSGTLTKQDGTSFCLDQSCAQGIADLAHSKIRRLTPIECERLQAFPDNWTKTGLDEKNKVFVVSDTQRYKMCGNAVTVSVVQEIAEKLK